MMDGAPSPQGNGTASIGDTLDHLLDALRRQGLAIGTREQVAAHALVTELITLGRARAIGDLRHALRPLLARTPLEREAYDSVLASWAPEPAQAADETTPPPPPPPPRRWWLALLAVAVLALVFAVARNFAALPEGPRPIPPSIDAGGMAPPTTPGKPEPTEATEPERPPANTALQRIAVAAAAHAGAPSLQELAQSLPVAPPDSLTRQASPDGKLRASLSPDLRAVLFTTENPGRSLELKGHEDTITCLAFSPDSKTLATGSADYTIRLWNLSDGKQLRILRDDKITTGLAFSADGTRILAGAADGTVREWDAATGALRETSLRNKHPSGYARKFHEWTGLPLSVPIAIYGADGRDPTTWVRLAMALQRLERPGREPATLAELQAEAATILRDRKPEDIPAPYRLQALTRKLKPDQQGTKRADLVADLARSQDIPPGTSSVDIERALAITPNLKLSPDFHAGSSWQPGHASSDARFVPRWAPFIAFLFPLAFALFWLANSLALRKAYLRRRPPHVPPLRLDIVSEVGRRLAAGRGALRRIAQRLQARTPQATDRIDVAGTIARTLASGTGFISPAYAQVLRTPEYLVLIERAAIGDQQAEHLRTLARRIGELVPMSVYTFQSDPAWLEPQDAPDRPQPLEQVAATHAGSRLVILGTGRGLLDPFTLQPRAATSLLLQFPQRALLTPVPVIEWGRSEFAIARQLAMPLARATPEGFARLPDLLGLEGPRDGQVIDTAGDGLARALPAMLRMNPERFLFEEPTEEEEIPQLLRALRNFLDPEGFDWLCALAVYPAVQWDLTLYLGVALPARPGANPEREPLYREDRIAALTHLPWLQEGSMPPWLRRALIGELDRSGRATEVRDTIRKLIEAAQLKTGRRSEDDVLLRIAREEGHEPDRFFDDEVLLDFLARGRVEDFALSRGTWLERILPRGLLERLGIPGLVAGGVSLAYALAAWWVTPKANGIPGGLWNESNAPLVSGAWVPLAVLAAGAVLSLGLLDTSTTLRAMRNAARRMAAPSLALAGLLLLQHAGSQWLVPMPALASATAGIAVSFLALRLARRIATWQWMDTAPPPSRRWRARARDAAMAPILAIIAWLNTRILSGIPAGTDVALALIPFALGWWLARNPQRRPDASRHLLQGMAARLDATARVLAALTLAVPALLLASHVAGSNRPLADINAASPVIAATQDARLLAVAGPDGRVQVFDRRDPAAPPRSVATPLSAIATLALAQDDAAKAPIVAALDTKGLAHVRRLDGTTAPASAAWADTRKFPATGHAPQLTLSPEGHLLVGVEDASVPARLVAGADPGASTTIERRGSITALAALDRGRFAVATMDGSILLAGTSADGSIRVTPKPALAFPNSRARHLAFNPATRRLTAIGDDGSALSATLLRDGTVQRKTGMGPAAALADWLPAVKGDRIEPATASLVGRDCPECPEMVVVPPGSFVMGSPASEEGRLDLEGPQRTVTIARAFAVGRFEVTFAEWDACVADGGCNGYRPSDEGWGRGNRPVINVSWNDAQAYVQWLSNRTGKRYRLLSEAEWEYVARAGTTTAYPWGSSASHEFANYGKDGCCDGLAQGRDRWVNTAPVGSLPANRFLLHDMHGNVAEWTEACSNESYAGAPSDGSAWRSGECSRRVLRGGSWVSYPQNLRSARRNRNDPSNRNDFNGFRVARTL